MDKTMTEIVLAELLQQLQLRPGDNKGWIRTIRLQKGMQGKELARIMRVSPARISVLERDELRGAVTLKMMQRAAEALDCAFVYAVVPKSENRMNKPRVRLGSSHFKQDKARQLNQQQPDRRDRRESKDG